ncbi:hypothetical protein IscW_ISCW010102 [Ixodes scapularis]|uniref:MADF domain-containing protein n=1 Tax=Ixodes scapularis TaxID=6945 RepID=B7PY21_IXOSC|nr:hypothetical protein IscW_ISCW010102 [Ixodes scapularis]|eukprot:XP_002402390.1 hypothetical protein IscW_ISCW010102 [Ixodes scapularis]
MFAMADGTASRVRYNERLIAEVEQRPSLWDSRSPKNRNVVTKNADWRRVAAALNSSGGRQNAAAPLWATDRRARVHASVASEGGGTAG